MIEYSRSHWNSSTQIVKEENSREVMEIVLNVKGIDIHLHKVITVKYVKLPLDLSNVQVETKLQLNQDSGEKIDSLKIFQSVIRI